MFNGSPLTWFRWIGEFRCLINNSVLGPKQKLTALSNYLNPEDRRLLTDISGGNEAYKYALSTLKRLCGRRDLKRELYAMVLRNRTAVAFYDFVLQISAHLRELHRLKESGAEDIIEYICAKIPQEKQDV